MKTILISILLAAFQIAITSGEIYFEDRFLHGTA